ncbi:prostaglandin reductase 1-like [Nasonia vitripennis]|uniref:Prostaglandin reductase 1 n=1 Tax=Nasonia vitripennis TaxID=7425 RepID=A0A7M7LLS4_NASVI|nr:prostaglandin reductase 1-like [Nasonia vitripennis]
MVRAKKYVFRKYFLGEPKASDFSLEEEDLPDIKDGEFLVEAEYLSVDPYMRKVSSSLPLGTTMLGSQVARIVESRNPDYSVGKHIVGYMGWRTHTIMHPDNFEAHSFLGRLPYLMPDLGDLPVSVSLGVLGQPGLTAYFGLTEICKPKKGDTIVVSGAAGAVGSLVGQMAKLYGCRTIGIAGSTAKCVWLITELGFDATINYKEDDLFEKLKDVAPMGVDIYFDNVGGEISSAVIYQMNTFGRVAVCGSISSYNHPDPKNLPKCTIIQPPIVSKQLSIQGFLVARWKDRKDEGLENICKWLREGKLKHKESVTEGFENMFEAFRGMLKGDNFGKAIVRIKH